MTTNTTPGAKDFYAHFWACEPCKCGRPCDEGQRLRAIYDAGAHRRARARAIAEDLLAIPPGERSRRRAAWANVPEDLKDEVQTEGEKLKCRPRLK